MLLSEYIHLTKSTDKLPINDLNPVLLGLFGEVGSIMTTAKKLHREREALIGYHQTVVEEFGDALWYLAAICRRLDIQLDILFSEIMNGIAGENLVVASDLTDAPIAVLRRTPNVPGLDETLLQLGEATAAILSRDRTGDHAIASLREFVRLYLESLKAANMSFAEVVDYNVKKTRGRFLDPEMSSLPTFDKDFEPEEQIPDKFEIRITQRKSGKCYLQMNGVFIGDPLTDNIPDVDGYRFHDVFHFAHAAVLHWSPTFRALIKHKRKSDSETDETQDSGRATVVEEGLTAWIFSRAKELGFFEGRNTISFDLLKTIQQFVSGYEVEECPLKLWENAILQGYEVFREVRAKGGGLIIGDRIQRKVVYKPLGG